jgi:gliding motility-associated-like protein
MNARSIIYFLSSILGAAQRRAVWLCFAGTLSAGAALGQSTTLILEECGVSYIDPQSNSTTNQNRDTLRYEEYFDDRPARRNYYVDLNAFGGQQPDRVRVYAIMPDSSLKDLGGLAFGVCVDCLEGFALVQDSALLVSGVNTVNTMNMWLQSLSQPPFALPGNLQTLTGVGRVSGTLPVCAIGWRVEYSVFSDPSTTTTEFATHILCPEFVRDCAIAKEGRIDCQQNAIELETSLPAQCYSSTASARWYNAAGWSAEGLQASLPLAGNEGWYYFELEDGCCLIVDSLLIANPPFADAGPDRVFCQGEAAAIAGTGGSGHFWSFEGNSINDSVLVFAAIQPEQEGLYILHAFNELGCEDTDTLLVNVRVPPAPEFELPGLCLGDTVRLQALNDSLYAETSWLNPQGLPFSPPVINGLQPMDFGPYAFTGTDSLGCQAQQLVEVSGSAPPEFEYTIVEICDTAQVYLFPDIYEYVWETGLVGSPLTVTAGGLYHLTITDDEGCRTLSSVLVPPPDGLGVSLEVEQPRCPNELGRIEFLADSNNPVIFSIDGGERYALSPRFANLPPGDYLAVALDALGCTRQFPVQIIAPDTMGVALSQEVLEVRPNTPVALEATTIGDIVEYQWLPRSIDTGQPVTDFLASTNLDVRIIVRDSRGCIASAAMQLTVVLGEIYAPNAFSPNGDGRNDTFTFFSDNGSGEIIEVLRVFDRWGGLLFEGKELALNDTSQGWDGTAGGKPLNAGLYAYYGIVRFGNGAQRVLKGDVALIR